MARMVSRTLLLWFLSLSLAQAAPGPVDNVAVDQQCLAIETAFAENRLEALEALQPSQVQWQLLRYFRLAAAYIPMDERRKAGNAIRAGIALAQDHLKGHPNAVEELLLSSMLDGQYLLLRPWRFFVNGRRGLRRIERVETLDPSNPRIALIRGTAKVVLPGIFGGDPAAARALFEASLNQPSGDELTFAQTPLCTEGEWAQVDLLNWLGRAHARLGNEAESKAAYKQALTRSPGNHWVILAMRGEGYEWEGAEAKD